MEGHAAFPEHEGIERMAQEVAGIVDQHMPEPAADDDAESHIDDEIVDADGRGPRLVLVPGVPHDDEAHIGPSRDEAADIGQRIPAQRQAAEPERQRPNVDRDGIYDRKGDDQE